MACAICENRRPRRYCPGVHGDICSVCCGEEREVSINCPLDCEYLQAARHHEKPHIVDTATAPNTDIAVTGELLRDNYDLLTFVSLTIFRTAMDTPGVVDRDVEEALESLVRTFRTLLSGVYYETRPTNPFAFAIFGTVQQALAEYRRAEHRELGLTKTRDADCLAVFAFLQRFAIDQSNGRSRGRAFIDALREFYPAETEAPPSSASSIIFP
jgi:hypothetical protein